MRNALASHALQRTFGTHQEYALLVLFAGTRYDKGSSHETQARTSWTTSEGSPVKLLTAVAARLSKWWHYFCRYHDVVTHTKTQAILKCRFALR